MNTNIDLIQLNSQVLANDITVRITDARNCFGGCPTGWRNFIEGQGLDWKKTVHHGLKASQLLATKDAMAISLVEYVYRSK